MADYNFYRTMYGGGMSEGDFERISPRTGHLLASVCMGRLCPNGTLPGRDDKAQEAVSMAFCALAEHLLEREDTGNREVVREAVGSHRVEYGRGGMPQSVRSAVLPYLRGVKAGGVPLLYRGVAGRDAP